MLHDLITCECDEPTRPRALERWVGRQGYAPPASRVGRAPSDTAGPSPQAPPGVLSVLLACGLASAGGCRPFRLRFCAAGWGTRPSPERTRPPANFVSCGPLSSSHYTWAVMIMVIRTVRQASCVLVCKIVFECGSRSRSCIRFKNV